MKRGAEKYLTDRNADEEEEEDEEVQLTGSESFKAAAPTELARRPIRGLPGKRSSSSTPVASPGANGAAPSTGFSFGAAPAAPSFSFGAASPAPASTSSKPATNGFSFGSPASSAKPPKDNASTGGGGGGDEDVAYYSALRGLNLSILPPLQRLLEKDPFVDLSKALNTILNKYKEERSQIQSKRKPSPSSQSNSANKETSRAPETSIGQASKPMFSFSAPSPATPSASASSTPSVAASSAPPAAPKAFAGFSFGGASASSSAPAATDSKSSESAATQTKSSAPFSGFEFGASTAAPSNSAATPVEAKSAPKEEQKAPAKETPKGLAPPAPPASFSFAGNSFKLDPNASATSSRDSTPSAGGFVFNPTQAEKSDEPSKFAFPATAAPKDNDKLSPEPSAAPKTSNVGLSGSAAPFMPTGNSRARQPSPLRQVETFPDDSKKKEAPAAAKPFSGFSFGSSSASAPPAATSTPSKGFSFGSAAATTSPKASPSFGFGTSSTSPKGFTSSAGFSFGGNQASTSTSTAPATSGFSFGSTTGPATGSAFGSSATTATTSTFGAPSTSGSAGGFGGFSFKPAAASGAFGSAFGASAGTTPSSSTNGTPAPENGAGDAGEENGDSAQEASENSLLKGGAGEENEETIYEARAKLWKNETKKIKEGDSEVEKTEFVDHGICIVKLNRNKETGKVRMLGRSDANGRVQINFALFKDLKLKVEKAFLTFMAFEDGSPMLLRLKLRNAELAGKFKDAIESEVSSLS